MADVEKKRKSVSFSPGAVVVDGDGAVAEVANVDQNGVADPAVDEVNVCRLFLSVTR
jgi:hypothetical protein